MYDAKAWMALDNATFLNIYNLDKDPELEYLVFYKSLILSGVFEMLSYTDTYISCHVDTG